eukprot:6176248-Pleurochrysis_carterae.AAC.3
MSVAPRTIPPWTFFFQNALPGLCPRVGVPARELSDRVCLSWEAAIELSVLFVPASSPQAYKPSNRSMPIAFAIERSVRRRRVCSPFSSSWRVSWCAALV